MKRLLSPAIFGLALFFLCTVTILPAPAQAAQDVQSVPTLTKEGLQTLIRDTGNRVVVINFFASWCPPCREELPELIALRAEYPAEQVDVLGISLDSSSQALDTFAAKQGFNYPVYRDDGSIAQAMGLGSIPFNVVLSGTGSLVYSGPGMINKELLKEYIEMARKQGNAGN